MNSVQRAIARFSRITLPDTVVRANEPLAAQLRTGSGTGLTSAQIQSWLTNLGHSPRSDFGQLYQQSVPVYRAVKLRSDAVSRARLKVYRNDGRGNLSWVGDRHEVQELLDRVNPSWTRNRMWRAVETYLGIWGSSFRYVNKAAGPVNEWEIWPLRPDRMQVVVGNDGDIAGYVHDPQGSRVCLTTDEVIWDRYFNPLDEFAGQSPLMAGRQSVEMQRDMLEFNQHLFQGGLLVSNLAFFLNGPLMPEQLEEFYTRLESRYSGKENFQRPIVFDRGQGDVKNLGLSNREMEFLEGIQLAKEHVADCYAVPEELMAGARHPTFSNREAALRDFYRNTVTQEWDFLAAEMQESFVPMLPFQHQDLVLKFDTSAIQELEESLSERTDRNLKLIAAGR